MLAESVEMPTKAKIITTARAVRRGVSASALASAWFDDMVARGLEGMRTEGKPYTFTDDLTPERAHVLLSKNSRGNNDHNRTLSETSIEQFTKDIANGNYPLNGESIIVSGDGFLNDGQHRCHAVIRAGKPITTVFVFGPERETRTTVDQGKIKTGADYLSMEGIPDATNVAATAGLVWQYRNLGLVSRNQTLRANKSEIRKILHDEPKIFESVKAIPFEGAGRVGGRSLLSFCYHIFAEATSTGIADEFFAQLIGGTNLSPSSPILRTRNRLMERKPFIGALPISAKAELLFRTWNAWRKGEEGRRSVALTGDRLPNVEA